MITPKGHRNKRGQFIKGIIPWSKLNKGKYNLIFSNPKLRGERIRNSKLGKKYSLESRKRISDALTGRKLSVSHIEAVRNARIALGLKGEKSKSW